MVRKTHDNDPEPERYYDWMLWKMRQEDGIMSVASKEDMWKKTIADMQGEIHALQKTIVRLQDQIRELEVKDKKDDRQLEFDLDAIRKEGL
tara:strand:- start:1301 stop:1573 length:273 start_codon:yes stop_codon:yes gene_type:complete